MSNTGPEEATKLAVLIVSYGNPDDVDRCLKSLAQSDLENFDVFICENAGREAYASLMEVIAHEHGTLQQMKDCSNELDRPGGRLARVAKCRFRSRSNLVRIALAIDNLGYGGGVNAWLERLLGQPGWHAVLVLNPDTEVVETCLSQLVAKAAEGYGMVGGVLVFDDSPNKVANYGLRWSALTGRVTALGRNSPAGRRLTPEMVEKIDAISGACVLVTRDFIADVGLMMDDYFLYMEDLDWGRRRANHRIGVAEGALIRHVGGTTIGSAVDPRDQSHLSVYLSARNGILYSRRRAGWRWVFHSAIWMLYALRYLLLGAPAAAMLTITGLWHGMNGRTGRPEISFDRRHGYR
ncbi:hypothetical protein GGD66_004351 [Bradyrhizobium sp. CIR48]|uniref:glycosyltransferase family 2 protein n=1 Tax=unclassified Bradyrhizobium TaxID=2631580 RepID=UPI0008E8D442|nr:MULTISPECIES: glycosyltransferase family 2 protein [unclassified Bradyrhizobium]MBB4425790.1 hypothetical protein [Bradyrhizobium sp. CIR48]SFN72025.1 Glycosyltransferase, GT2 family [Bradyrhizobium sp. Rc3b]